MPENMNINGRRSIHDRDGLTPQRENSESEDDDFSNEISEQLASESGSDGNVTYIPEYPQREMSRSVPRTPERPKRAASKTYSPESEAKQAPPKQASKGFFIISPFVLLVISGCVYASLQKNGIKEKICSYETLQQQYPQEKSFLWRALKVGIESILNKRIETPGVYLFVHNGGDRVHKLVKDIAAHSSTCFGKEMRPVEMEGEDFIVSPTNNDYGGAIEKYKTKIKDGNVILIANLNEIPAEAARALHTICDTYSPIAKDVVIFLTLTIPPIVEGNVESNVEDTLINLWGTKLGSNELYPLIARVTDQVIALHS